MTLTEKSKSQKRANFMNLDRQTDSQTDRQTARQIDRQPDQQTVTDNDKSRQKV